MSAIERFYCKICKSNFKTKRTLKQHMEWQDCQKVYSCNDCGKKSKFSLENHKNYCPAMAHLCTICQKSFKNRNMLEHHQIRHRNQREFGCDECGKRFNTNSDLNVHHRIHTGERNFNCNDCGKSFQDSSQLRNHRYVHSEAREFLCHCGKGFKTSYALKTHTIVHKDVRDYECYICEKSFKGDFHLKYHMQIHNDVSFACKACGKSFKKKAYLTSHMQKRHTEERDKPHQCNICGKSFVIKSHMNAHTKKQHPETLVDNWEIQDNDVPQQDQVALACVLCDKTIPTVGDLNNHIKSEHKVSSNSTFFCMASKLYTSEPSNMNVVTLIMDEILQEGKKGAMVEESDASKEEMEGKKVKTESALFQESETRRKENITTRIKTRSLVSSTKKDKVDHCEKAPIPDGRELEVEVKVETIEGETGEEGVVVEKGKKDNNTGRRKRFEVPRNQNQIGKKRKIVFGKRSRPRAEMPRNENLAKRVEGGGGPPGPPQGPPGPPQGSPEPPQGLALVERCGDIALDEMSGGMVEKNNEWEEALDMSSSQVQSSICRDELTRIPNCEKEKIPVSPLARIPNQLLKDFQELCRPDVESFL